MPMRPHCDDDKDLPTMARPYRPPHRTRADRRPPLAAELVAAIERACTDAPMTTVAAVHRPPVFERGRTHAEFFAVELDDGSIGLGYALLDGISARLHAHDAGTLLAGTPALDAARGYLASDPLHRALGLATINALSAAALRRLGWRAPDATDSIGGIDPRPGQRIGMVGWFPPLVRRIAGTGASLVVVEIDPTLAGVHDGVEVTLDPGALGDCDTVLSTTTPLLNHTLDAVLDACPSGARVVLIGPTGGCLPQPLFARGVDALGGTEVTDRAGFVEALRRGEPWGRYVRKTLVDAREPPPLR